MTETSHRNILISGQEYELPYSKGLMASRIMATGLAPARAFHVAQVVENRLHLLGGAAVSPEELHRLVLEVLREEVDEHHADSFSKWQQVLGLDVPLVILLGGATGVGKSTLATMLASRLGINRVVPTDAIREVMRAMFSADLMPSLHTSSFDAARMLRDPLADADPVVMGFREQAAAVSVGVSALISRAADEGTDLIVEGVHFVPGFVDQVPYKGRAVVVPMVITVEDDDLHRSHFLVRAREVRNRPSERYLDHFPNIRKLQGYVTALARHNGVPLVASYNLDATLSQIIDLVVNRAVEAVPEPSHPTSVGASEVHHER